MTSQPIPIRIPLMKISGKVEPEDQAEELPQGLKWFSDMEISVPQGLPESCYALEIPDIVKEFAGSESSLGVFGPGEDVVTLNDIYALGLAGREPLVGRVIKSDAHSDSDNRRKPSPSTPSSQVRNRRKSFMTPTPLHIPHSQVSPIPDSAHEMIYLKGLSENESLKVIPLRDVVWMHSLIAVI